ncbi:sulfatase-like hydrolase/transferase [Rhodopirellula halodulae]|uniref:sulfatase-like hydrolase/transferase n=1 Tax=Rhodopirellula halodulae TaxID=2894198 RepID=UPI001E3D5F8F|nr:sulfatase-like hydrolase/transferase [Rhodopirellula sp. JC737]MCC9654240.1 sulfatase-like hydrolase/transferase [Rhodopirellula sp. JC737]
MLGNLYSVVIRAGALLMFVRWLRPESSAHLHLGWRSLLWGQLLAIAVLMTLGRQTHGLFLVPLGNEAVIHIAAWRVIQASSPLLLLYVLGILSRSKFWVVPCMTAWWYLILLDLVVYRWAAMHVLSGDFFNLVRERTLGLLPYLTFAMVLRFVVAISLIALATWLGLTLADRTAKWLCRRQHRFSLMGASVAWAMAVLLLAAPACWNWPSTLAAMHAEPSRHPFCVFGCFDPRSSVVAEEFVEGELPLVLRESAVQRRAQAMRFNVASAVGTSGVETSSADVLLVVVESLRPEVVDAEVMPNLHTAAERGVWLRNHFSGGNASSLGLFSLVNGLDAIWFYRADVRFAPAMNRLFHQAGYECGFFGAAEDWAAFQMDAFIREEVYDAFNISPFEGLRSDQEAIQACRSFLAKSENRGPRLAVLYLYATHAPFEVDLSVTQDEPAASRHYPLPFGPNHRPAVWNRYRNAARSVDRILAPLLQRQDCIVAVVGDHGESFLDDGTIGHGTRLSAVQTQTPAIIVGPDVVPKTVAATTSHADLLPTLLSLCDVSVSDSGCFDGRDLTDAKIRPRVIAVADYLREQALLVPSEEAADRRFLGLQVEISLVEPRLRILGPRGEVGNVANPEVTSPLRLPGMAHDYLQQSFPE